ncbi:FGGY family carbohydrate kinase [Aestuariivirga sp.]|uniref:FGGY family carbohydrate kinase n=1 Tax=Aestuariivirga sp. TaxID=2650926 RepID=UPI0039E425FA
MFVGVDVGSTNIKALFIDEAGEDLWVKSVPSPRRHDGYGVVTEGLELIAALEELIIEGWRAVGKGKPIAAIATTGIGEDGFCLDAECRPRGLAIPWFDHRDKAEAAFLMASDEGRAHPWINFAFSTAAAKWLWLRKHRPESISGNDPWVTLTDFPAVWWARRKFICTTLIPRTGVYDVFKRQWIPSLLQRAEAPPLPEGLVAGEIVGTVVPGPLREAGACDANTLIVVAGHDHPIASNAIMRIEPLARIDSIGTANALFAETTTPSAGAATAGIDLSLPVRGGPGISVIGPIEFSVPMRQAFGSDDNVKQYLSAPHLPGAPAKTAPTIAAALADTGPDHHRRVIEAVTVEARDFFRAMKRVGIADGPMYATGGWARSRALMELRASIFGEPIIAVHEPELTALGAALFAMEGATGKMPYAMQSRTSEVIDPRKDWMEIYAGW